MKKSRMNLHPFYDCTKRAEGLMEKGATIFQQWNCAHCGAKQTMPDANAFYKLGDCEECGKRTNIEQDGCNYMAVYSVGKPLPGVL